MNLEDGKNSRLREQIEQKNTLEVYLMFYLPHSKCTLWFFKKYLYFSKLNYYDLYYNCAIYTHKIIFKLLLQEYFQKYNNSVKNIS